jgi:heavy-metal-associated domain-containing protein
VRVALKSVNGVDSVDVSLNKGLATVTLKDGNTVTMKQLQAAIIRNGYSTKQSLVIAIGQLSMKDNRWLLHVSGSNEEFALTPDGNAKPPDNTLIGKVVIVVGAMPQLSGGNGTTEMHFQSVTGKK